VVDNDDEPKVVEVPQAKAAEQVLVVMVDQVECSTSTTTSNGNENEEWTDPVFYRPGALTNPYMPGTMGEAFKVERAAFHKGLLEGVEDCMADLQKQLVLGMRNRKRLVIGHRIARKVKMLNWIWEEFVEPRLLLRELQSDASRLNPSAIVYCWQRVGELLGLSTLAKQFPKKHNMVVLTPTCFALHNWDPSQAEKASKNSQLTVQKGEIMALLSYSPSSKWAVVWQPDEKVNKGNRDQQFGFAAYGRTGSIPRSVVASLHPLQLRMSRKKRQLNISIGAFIFDLEGKYIGPKKNYQWLRDQQK
jgi:hypothetical protein